MTMMQMKYFITVASCLNFTEAARILHMTQPALSRQMSALEQELNILLFSRDRRSVRLTPAGKVFLEKLEGVYSQYLEAMEMARDMQWGKNSSLEIGILSGHNISLTFPKLIGYMERKNADISVGIFRASFAGLNSALYSGQADVIITAEEAVEGLEMIEYINIARAKNYLVMHRDNPLSEKDHITAEDLREQIFLQASQEDLAIAHYNFYKEYKRLGCRLPPRESPDLETGMLWLRANMGIGILNSHNELALDPEMCFVDSRRVDGLAFRPHNMSAAWLKSNTNPALALFRKAIEHSGAIDAKQEPPVPVNAKL